jgi:hypothetical protein
MKIHRNTEADQGPHTLIKNCVIVKGLIGEDRRVEVHEIAEVTGIAKGTVHEIISDLNFHKVSACWVPKMLTEEHKSKIWLLHLKIFAVTKMKENHSWKASLREMKHGFTNSPQSQKRTSMTWKHPHSPTTKKFKIEPPAKRTMAIVFWDCEGLLLCEFLPPKTTINSDKYCETLEKLHEAIKQKRPG